MSSNYSNFNYDNDFTPTNFIFNTNTTNKRYVGIGSTIPNSFLQLNGNVSTTNLQFNETFFYNKTSSTNTNNNYISLLNSDSNNNIILPNLVSSTFEDSGVEWSISNNNNIKLTLRNDTDNTRIDYFSPVYNIIENIFTTHIFPSSTLTLKNIYILKNDNSILLENDPIFNTNITIQINGIISTLKYLSNGFFKLNNYISLSNNKSHTIELTNLNGHNIQLYGNYDYYSGSKWNQINSTTFTMNKVGIGTQTPEYDLHVIGNSHITGNLNIENTLNSTNLISNKLFLEGTNNINYIQPNHNSILINSNKKSVGIATTTTNEIFSVGSHFKIKDNGDIFMNNLNISHNINYNSTTSKSFINQNYSILFNKSTIQYKHNNNILLQNNSNNINIYNNLNLINSNQTYDYGNNQLYIDGNLSISGNLILNKINNFTSTNTTDLQNLNTNLITINNLLQSDSFIYTDSLNTDSLNIQNKYILPIKTTNNLTSNKPELYYNSLTNKYMIYNTVNTFTLQNKVSFINKNDVYKLYTNSSSDIQYIQTDNITTDELNCNNPIILNNSTFYYNLNSMREEITLPNTNNSTFFDIMY